MEEYRTGTGLCSAALPPEPTPCNAQITTMPPETRLPGEERAPIGGRREREAGGFIHKARRADSSLGDTAGLL